jgi:hypothetical protein
LNVTTRYVPIPKTQLSSLKGELEPAAIVEHLSLSFDLVRAIKSGADQPQGIGGIIVDDLSQGVDPPCLTLLVYKALGVVKISPPLLKCFL